MNQEKFNNKLLFRVTCSGSWLKLSNILCPLRPVQAICFTTEHNLPKNQASCVNKMQKKVSQNDSLHFKNKSRAFEKLFITM